MTNLALKLAENARSIGVSSAYGDPVQIEGVTVVPVALVQYGFGAGGQDTGDGAAEKVDGFGGGGGGGLSIPLGVYTKHGTSVRFDPNIVPLLAVGIPFVWVAGRALARVIRAIKR